MLPSNGSTNQENKKVLLPGPSLAFHTNCADGNCPPGQALRFQTKCRRPAAPISTGSLDVSAAPGAA